MVSSLWPYGILSDRGRLPEILSFHGGKLRACFDPEGRGTKILRKTLIWPRPIGQTVSIIATGAGRLASENGLVTRQGSTVLLVSKHT